MPSTNRALMAQARQSLKGRWTLAALVTLVYMLLILCFKAIPGLGWIGILIISGPYLLGWSIFFLSLSRKQEARLSQLFEGFYHFGNALAAYLLMTLFIILWTILLFIPGVVACLSYSQTFFILADNPQRGGLEALRESKSMMKGNRWKLFCLLWRFLGWFLLAILTLGIGYLWVMPYLGTTLAHFYDELNPRVESPSMEMEEPVSQLIQY
jgi:uncharacterized membrane protein